MHQELVRTHATLHQHSMISLILPTHTNFKLRDLFDFEDTLLDMQWLYTLH